MTGTEENAMPDTHAHDIMHMMLEHPEGFTRASLERAIVERFGPHATFCSCSASGMNVGQVIDFLESRGKFVPAGEGFNTAPDRICNH